MAVTLMHHTMIPDAEQRAALAELEHKIQTRPSGIPRSGNPASYPQLVKSFVVSVAQLVEHRSVAPRVAGSNPVAHPNFFNNLTPLHFPLSCTLVPQCFHLFHGF
jgi:hypothetical protein